jgi:hypothetical protein
MFRAVVLCLLLVGCYKPSFRDCAVSCDESTGCPSGLTCDMTAHMCALGSHCGAGGTDSGATDGTIADARVDADPTSDPDMDGIVSGSDNCPFVSNADQADEDMDHVGDACDPCPIDAGTVDSDNDGLPDGCDPHPTINSGSSKITDAIIRFEPFNSGLGGGAVSHGSALPSAGGGHAFIQAGGGHEGYLTYPVDPQGRGITVYALVHYANVPPTGNDGGGPITEVVAYDLSNNGRAVGYGCEVNTAGGNFDLSAFQSGNQSYNQSAQITNLTAITQPLRVSAGTDSGTAPLTCRVASPVAVVPSQGGNAPSFDAGIYAHGVNTTFDYVLIVATTP